MFYVTTYIVTVKIVIYQQPATWSSYY